MGFLFEFGYSNSDFQMKKFKHNNEELEIAKLQAEKKQGESSEEE